MTATTDTRTLATDELDDERSPSPLLFPSLFSCHRLTALSLYLYATR
jgi:hypothetical protein